MWSARQMVEGGGRMLILLAALLPVAAIAQTTFEYNVQPRTFKACRLLVPYLSGGNWTMQAPDGRSLIFEGMRRYPDRPGGWDLENPLAATSALLKNTNSYWEVPLNPTTLGAAAIDPVTGACAALPQLTGMDLIYIWAGDPIVLNMVEPGWREALIRAVHGGAVLWIDQWRAGNGTVVTEFAPPGSMTGLGGAPFGFTWGAPNPVVGRSDFDAAAGDPTGNLRDRLLQYPFNLSRRLDIPYLGQYPDPATACSLDYLTLNDPGFHRVVDIWDGGAWLPNIAMMRFGAGAIVLSAGDVGYDVVNWWLGAHRNRPLQHEAADCKFAWNMLALTSTFAERGGSPANTGASAAVIPPPLSIQWQYPDRFESATALPLGSVVSSPVIGRNMTYSVSQGRVAAGGIPAVPPMLLAFDSDPAQDLDGDGRADDGIIDYSTGRSHDLVWAMPLDTSWSGANNDLTPRWSSPTVATMGSIEVVLVSLTAINPGPPDDGFVVCYRADNGAFLWSRTLDGYQANSIVVDVSSPTVFRDFVFVSASEYDAGADPGAGAEDTYGRAHCFQLTYNWAADQNGPQWVFPNASINPNGDGDTTNGSPDEGTPENQRSLPSFQDPYWVAAVAPYNPRPVLPPVPTAKPTLSEPDPPGSNSGVDVRMHCVSPISLVWDETANEVNNDTGRGGSETILLPTPQLAGVDYLNQRAFRVWLPEATTTAVEFTGAWGGTGEVRRVTPTANVNITAMITGLWQDPVDGRVYAYLRSGEAREYLLPPDAGGISWLDLIQGAGIGQSVGATQPGIWYRFDKEGNGNFVEEADLFASAKLPGPVERVITSGEANTRQVASVTSHRGNSLSAADTVENNDGTLVAPATPGSIRSIDNQNGEVNWSLRPDRLSTDSAGKQLLARGGIAVEPATRTAVAAVASAANPNPLDLRTVTPAILGLNAEPRLIIQLRDGTPDAQLRAGAAVDIFTLNAAGTGLTAPADLAGAFMVDTATKTIEFATDRAGWVSGNVGMLWGKPVWVTYRRTDPANPGDPGSDATVTAELHILPDMVRFQYTPGVVKLNHSMVRADAELAFNLPNGVPLTRTVIGLDSLTVPAAALPTAPVGWVAVWGRALLEVNGLAMPGGEVLRPGREFMVTYSYIDPVTLTVQTAHERHQVPVNFGAPVSSPAMAGYNMHVGTEGYRPDNVRGAGNDLMNPELYNPAAVPTPAQYNGARKSLLSVLLDPITQTIRGALAQVAIPDAASYLPDWGTPVTSSSPAVDGDGVVIGSRLMRRLSQVAAAPMGYQGEELGFVSRLKPERTLVCDNTRLVEVTGSKLNWMCTGTLAPMYHEALDPMGLGAQELKATPFSRPAKAIYLANGNMLVADTGNNRVVEIDRQGRQVWPLDAAGYDYYTSTAAGNPDLALDRPADCFRYYVTTVGGATYTSANGTLLGPNLADPTSGTVMHTVIADTGNARVIDVVTTLVGGVQTHRADVLTPSRVRLAAGMMKLSYTKAVPVFDPLTNVIIGYVCAAANMHQLVVVEAGTRRVNPAANLTPTNGSAGSNWRWLAWLYDGDVLDADYSPTNPLVFRNIRDVQFVREGTQMFLTVTCGQYAGRLGNLGAGNAPHWLAAEGAGIFEFAIDIGNGIGNWARISPVDVGGGATVTTDDPIWYFANRNYTYDATGARRSLTNIQYNDVDGNPRWLEMPWNPVSCRRLPVDRRAVAVGAATGRAARHMITNYAELIQNLSRDNLNALTAPAMLFSSVFVVDSDDANDAAPENDLHELDRREVIPDPHEADWTDPINQPAYADRR